MPASRVWPVRRLLWFGLGAATAMWGMRRGPELMAQARREGAQYVVDRSVQAAGQVVTLVVARLTAGKGVR